MGGGITGENVRRRTPISKEEKEKKEVVRDGVRAKDTEVRAEKDTGGKGGKGNGFGGKGKGKGKGYGGKGVYGLDLMGTDSWGGDGAWGGEQAWTNQGYSNELWENTKEIISDH